MGKKWQTIPAAPPLFDADEILYTIPTPCKASDYQGLPMRKIVARIVDGSNLAEFKGGYGNSILTGFARIEGHPVGVVASAAPRLCINGARKAAHFVTICDQRKLPVIFLQDVLGFDVAADSPAGLKEAALLMRAVSCARVPRLTVYAGKAIGPASYAMCGQGMNPDFSFSWPSAQTMIATDEQLSAFPGTEATSKESSAAFGAARLWVDDVVAPAKTREALAQCLDIAQHSLFHSSNTDFGVFRL